jgi:inorganic pyrophosphatase
MKVTDRITMITLKIKIIMDRQEEEARVEGVLAMIEADVAMKEVVVVMTEAVEAMTEEVKAMIEGVGDMIEILLKTLIITTSILNFKTLIKTKMIKINTLRGSKSQKNLMKSMLKTKFKNL